MCLSDRLKEMLSVITYFFKKTFWVATAKAKKEGIVM